MPGEENPELSDQLATSMEEGQETTSQPYVQDNGQAERLLTTSQGTRETQESQQQKLLAGKYKTPQELEKAYLNQNGGYRKLETRAQQLERLLENPQVQAQLASDPQAREIMAKLGYELIQEETRRDEQTGGGQWNGDTNDPRFIAEVVRQENRMNWDFFRLERSVGRDLSPVEVKDVKRIIGMAPRLTVEQAWKLTPHYEKMVKDREEKAIQQAQARRPQVNRPRPVAPGGVGGPKPQGKSPLGLRDDEKGQFLNDLIDKAERGT